MHPTLSEDSTIGLGLGLGVRVTVSSRVRVRVRVRVTVRVIGVIVKTMKLKLDMQSAHIAGRPFLNRLPCRPYHIIHRCQQKIS